jgi:hypothetical protein
MNIESYPEEYLDVNFLIQTLFNFMHTDQVKEFLPDINYTNISITDTKLLLPIVQQTLLINNIFNTDVKFQYRHANEYVFKRTFGVLSTDITLCSYVDEKDSIISPDNANSLVTWILSDLVIKKLCTGILLNVMTVDLKMSLLRSFTRTQPELVSFDDKKDDEYIKCTISEHFYKKNILNSIIDTFNTNELKSIIFQIMITISQIQEAYSGFRHNFLIADNIHVYQKVQSIKKVSLNGKTISYNDFGYEIKITNFSKSIIVGLTDNDALLPEKKVSDVTYDIITFLRDIENTDIIDVKKLLSKIKKYTANKKISLTNIIMTEYLDMASGKVMQVGGSKSKKTKTRSYKGIRYENGDDVKDTYTSKYESKYDDLPDSLSSLDDASIMPRSGSSHQMQQQQMPMNGMQQGMQMPMNGMQQGMQMPMNGMQMPMNGMQMPMNGPVDERQIQGMTMQQEIAKFMPPTGNNMNLTSANLRGGGSKGHIEMGDPNFFF